jgi:phosphotransferase system enzyme I (PtsI)
MYHLSSKVIHEKHLRIQLKGRSISSGCAIGTAFIFNDIFKRQIKSYSIDQEEICSEMARIKSAMGIVLKDLHRMSNVVRKDIGSSHANIFEAHKLMLSDARLYDDMEKALSDELLNAEQIVQKTFQNWSQRFELAENEIIKSKSDDMQDLGRRLLKVLLGYEETILHHLPPNSIVVAKQLLPSDTVHIHRRNVRGILVEVGGYNSHSAILARALAVPAITHIPDLMDVIRTGQELILDGDTGEVILFPTEADKIILNEKRSVLIRKERHALEQSREPIVHADGQKVTVMANASSKDEVMTSLMRGCDGIGLFRIEQFYLSRKTLPDTQEVYQELRKVFHHARTESITVRLLDIGGDKQLPYITMEDELSPMLGLRGVRVLLKHEQLLKAQIRALLLLNQEYNIRVMVPMVTLPKEMSRIRYVVHMCLEELNRQYNREFRPVKVGAMIETPAAVINVQPIAELSDFLSIGTNDLIQYTMAAGRENSSVCDYYVEGASVVLSSIQKVVRVAEQVNIPCCLCGEMGADLEWTKALLDSGIRHFSVVPNKVPVLKEHLRSLSV